MRVRPKSGCCRLFGLKTNLKVIYAAAREEMLHEIRESALVAVQRERGHFFSFLFFRGAQQNDLAL
jgi:hypothetical protein